MFNNLLQNIPPVTKNIILINVVMFAATIILENVFNYPFTYQMALHFYLSEDFKPYQLLTHMFMHGSVMHIFFNLFAIYIFGPALEYRLGAQKYFIFYLLTGFGAMFLHYFSLYIEEYELIQQVVHIRSEYDVEGLYQLVNESLPKVRNPYYRALMIEHTNLVLQNPNDIPAGSIHTATSALIDGTLNIVVGASGALFGILAGFALLYPNQRLIFIFIPYPIKAKYLVLGYAALELYLAFQNDPNDHIAHFAHLGGALFGFLIIKFWKFQREV